ncbi:MAG: hypothetical protein HW397_214 [Dehalococcoidia bacterium]|nr:hypothetical protein [Dehalococcoidia bacterium]
MVFVEKAGIPAVGIVAKSFARAWQSSVDGWGQPTTAFVAIPHATSGGQKKEFIEKMVDDQIDEILRGLTHETASQKPKLATGKAPELFTVEMDETDQGLNAINRFMAERDWTDGMAITPPTPSAVERMLKATKHAPQDVIMIMEPGFGLATVEKIAINAVMAGMEPAQFPVLLTAIACLAEPQMNQRDLHMSGHAEAPLILVNGPIAKKAGINGGAGAMGPGVANAANTAIGRALRLCFINIGDSRVGGGDPNFIGLPMKGGMVISENEEDSPWQPYHMDKGFKRDESVVTVQSVTGPICCQGGVGFEDVLNNIATTGMAPRNAGSGGWLRGPSSAQVGNTTKRVFFQAPHHPIILSPSRAMIMQNAGLSKKQMQEWLWKHCSIPLKDVLGPRGMDKDANGKWTSHPEFQHLESDPNATIPKLESPDQYLIFVAGGTTHYAEFFFGTYGLSTRPLEM